ncbi:MAG: hypothetical protein R3299_00425 [Arenibacter sp.]|nr:hypothetical protein [Arenibacter sp.]
MKKTIFSILSVSILLTYSCTGDFKEVVDFTDVENPNLSESSVVGQPNSAAIWTTGIEREISRTINEFLVLAELGSDNYVNTQTFFSQLFDGLDIRTTDTDIRDLTNEIGRVRAMATFGLETVGPNDEKYTKEQEAEFHFYLGYSKLLSAMYFSALPQETLGAPVSSADNYQGAINSFNDAIALSDQPEYHLGKARAYYYLGNKTEAVASAQAALNLDDSFTRSAKFDAKDGPSNTMQDALFTRSTFDDLQPLPTLDFLDPKYSFVSTDLDAPVHFLKAEEAYLIMAEANLADGAVGNAQTNLKDLLTLVATREVREVNDQIEGRTERAPGSRPDTTNIVVNGRSGLVLYRGGDKVSVPSVSGTSLTQTEIDNMTANDAALELLYRTRQEIFIAEGIRLVDMGVKMVINENEILQNQNISDGDPSTVPVIPSFIAAVVDDLDAIDYEKGSGVANTVIDLNAILVANKTSSEVLPFH